MHEQPQRCGREALARWLTPEELGLSPSLLGKLSGLQIEEVQWPTSLVPAVATRYSLPCSLVRQWSAALPAHELEALAAACNRPGTIAASAPASNLGSALRGVMLCLSHCTRHTR